MLGSGFLGQSIELACGGISFNLAIPTRVVIFDEPLTQTREGVVIEVLNLPLNLLNVGHTVLRSTPIVA